LEFEFLRFGGHFAKVMMIMLAVAVGWGLWHDLRRRTLMRPAVIETLALAATFLVIYIVLPGQYAEAAYVDVRALAPITIFIILSRAQLAEDTPSRPAFSDAFILPFAAVLATCNLVYLAHNLIRENTWATGYRDIIAKIPRDAAVLPVYTAGRESHVMPR